MITLIRRFSPWTLLGIVLFCLCGCDERESNEPVRVTPEFNHAVHVEDEEIQCAACHRTATKEAKAGIPEFTSCAKCHEGIDEDLAPEKRAKVFLKDGKAVWTRYTTLREGVNFSHKVHHDAKVTCVECHGKVGKSKKVSRKDVRVSVSDCMNCHKKKEVLVAKDNCAACHTTINKKWKPESHQHDWIPLHGTMVGFESKDAHGSCQECHTENSCSACHRDQPPQNHNNHFRKFGHGVLAGLDRTGCMVCHTDNSCVRCHKSVAPRSHRGAFANRHCVGCHFPLRDNKCNFCHKGTPSHNSAPSLPSTAFHASVSVDRCRDCHGGLKRPHVDDGGSCLKCHRR